MTRKLSYQAQSWALKEPFATSRGARSEVRTITVRIEDEDGFCGKGEAGGVSYDGETPETMALQLEEVSAAIKAGVSREELLGLLPPGGARYAVDSALWDLEAKCSGRSAFALAGIAPAPVVTAYTIGIRSLAEYEAAAVEHADFPCLKIKVARGDPVEAVRAVRRGAPRSRFIVDPNQSWSIEELSTWAPALAELGVELLEQPIPVGLEDRLARGQCPIRLCADELVNDAFDLDRAVDRFQVVNIKLDKAGGLTAALGLAEVASALGFELMVGCMAGSSLSIAPALILAQRCSFVDLDAPLLLSRDRRNGLTYRGAVIDPAPPDLWG